MEHVSRLINFNKREHSRGAAAAVKVTGKSIAGLISINVVYGLAEASNEFRTSFLKDQGLTATECGRVLAAASLICIFAGPMASALADKIRSRRIVYIGAATLWMASVVTLLLIGHMRAAGFALCAGIMPLISVFDPITYNMLDASGVNASIMVPKLDYSLIRSTLSIGYCLINFAYTPLTLRFGSAVPFLCTAGFVLVLILLSGSLRCFETDGNTGKTAKAKLEPVRIVKDYYLVTFLVCCFIHALGNCNISYLVYLMNEIGMDSSLLGTANGIRVAGEILFMLMMPFVKRRISVPLLQGISFIMQLIQMIVFVIARDPLIIMAALAFGGAAGGINVGTRSSYLRALSPKGLDTLTLALYTTMFSAGNIIMFIIGGVIIDNYGIFALYAVSGLFFAVCIVMYFATYLIGRYVLKKEPVLTMLSPWRNPKAV